MSDWSWYERYAELLGRVFDELQGHLRDVTTPEEYARLRHDFVFHMCDCRNDLGKLFAMSEAPESLGLEEAATLVYGLLVHIVPHLKAARRLLDELKDPFEGNETDEILDRIYKAEANAR
jgi:hypothetical protein